MWMFDKHDILTIKACIKGFLCAGNKKNNVVVKLSWSMLSHPKSNGVQVSLT